MHTSIPDDIVIPDRLTAISAERLAHYCGDEVLLLERQQRAVTREEQDQLAVELAAVRDRIATWLDPATSRRLARLDELSR